MADALGKEKSEGVAEQIEAGDKTDVDNTHVGLDETNLPDYHDKETQRILRRVDLRLIPLLTFLYVLSFLDRSNIANANVAGMSETLGLVGNQYNIANTVFFFPYALLEVPSNIILKLMRPSTWITIMMVSWGIVITLQGIVQNYHGLIATRVILGVCESGFFPAATYLVTTWYCRFELQRRLAVFYSAASLAGAFSGILAYGIQHMDGLGGLEGWRWMQEKPLSHPTPQTNNQLFSFILEGILTVLVGSTLHWVLPDSPETATFLEPHERDFLVRRLAQDAGTSAGKVNNADKFQWSSLKAALSEWKIWLAIIIWLGNAVPVYGFTYTAPTIIRDLGYDSAVAQLLTVPVYFFGVISVLAFSWFADRMQVRWVFIVGPYCISAAGFLALLVIPHPKLPGLTYFFLFFVTTGLYPALISLLSWIGNNLAPSWKRAVGMALLISGGNLGGAVGSNIFLDAQAPRYPLGYGMCLGMNLAAIAAAIVLRFAYVGINKRRDKKDPAEIREKYTEQELLDMGDKSPLYRYVT